MLNKAMVARTKRFASAVRATLPSTNEKVSGTIKNTLTVTIGLY